MLLNGKATLATLPALAKYCVDNAYIVADSGYADERVASTKVQRDFYWTKWRQWCSLVEIDPYLQNIAHQRLLIETTGFAGYVSYVADGRGKQAVVG